VRGLTIEATSGSRSVWWDIPLVGLSHYATIVTMAIAFIHRTPVLLRPDAKGRVGLDSLLRRAREYLGGVQIAGLAAEVASDGTITLRPRIEVDAETAQVLRVSQRDAEAFAEALAHPPKPNPAMRTAAKRWSKSVESR
jgi:hypothetical protein